MPDNQVPRALRWVFDDTQPPGLLDPDFDNPDFETLNLPDRSSDPTDSEITGDAAVYQKSGSLYIRPKGGTATEIGKSSEAIEDLVNDVLAGGSNITTTYNDSTNTLTLDVSPQGSGSGLNADTAASATDANNLDGNSSAHYTQAFSANLPSQSLNAGDYVALDRFTVPTGADLAIYTEGITNDAFNVPAGLNLVIRNATAAANERTVAQKVNQGNPITTLTTVAGDDIIIAADNGNFTAGTGAGQVVNAHITYRFV